MNNTIRDILVTIVLILLAVAFLFLVFGITP